METVGERVRQERDAQGLSRPDLAKQTGIGYSTLSELERGGMQTSTRLHVIADALGVSVRWLETGKGMKRAGAKPAEDSDWRDVLGYAQAVGLGSGAEAQEYAETHKLKFRAESLASQRLKPAGLAVMYGDGDSMLPRIHQGDAILFDTADVRPKDHAIFVVQWKGEIYAKRAMILDDVVYFTTDNLAGDHQWKKPKRMDAKREPIQILGRVRWIGSWEA
jgi:phage repressor protein C with HTH and peptisase S24 domain